MTKNKPAKIKIESGKQELFIEREFDAPRELVFKAFTDQEIYIQWIGPRGLTTTLETFEPENGGSWRYIQKDANGNEFAFHGTFGKNVKDLELEENICKKLPLVCGLITRPKRRRIFTPRYLRTQK